jgi:hypothetical protein
MVQNIHSSKQDTNLSLILAARNGNLEIAKLLLKHGALVDWVHPEFGSAVVVAAWEEHTPMVHMLLEHGASVSSAESSWRTLHTGVAMPPVMKMWADAEKAVEKASLRDILLEILRLKCFKVDSMVWQWEVPAVTKAQDYDMSNEVMILAKPLDASENTPLERLQAMTCEEWLAGNVSKETQEFVRKILNISTLKDPQCKPRNCG